MSFNSLQFLIFFPIVLLGYFIFPKKIKNLWLLLASYYFYMCWNAKYAVLIFLSTVITYASGIAMDKIKKSVTDEAKRKLYMNCTVAFSFIINLGILGYFKYTNFFLSIIERMLLAVHVQMNIPTFDILLPVGISFYTFQALGYTMDVYRDDIYAEKNFIQYALFVSFFPQLVAGPIERSKNLLKQLSTPKKFDYYKAREGLMLMMWGYFLKMVIADRAAVFVDTIWSDLETYGGWYIIIGAIVFMIQIYCDFYGYSTIAKGAAAFLGINLMENFEYPLLRTSVASLWQGWHISLTSWFRDYVYFPLGGSRKGKVRKYINIMIVFIASGLWHGASMSYVLWGMVNGLYQIIGDVLMPIRIKVCEFLHLDRNSLAHRFMLCIGTVTLFLISILFFRARSASEAFYSFQSIATVRNPWILIDGSLYNCGLNAKNFGLLMFASAILLFADVCKLKKIVIREVILRQHIIYRWLVVSIALIFILLFGIWGPSYDAAGFIYFQF